jgi:hypothetical protein
LVFGEYLKSVTISFFFGSNQKYLLNDDVLCPFFLKFRSAKLSINPTSSAKEIKAEEALLLLTSNGKASWYSGKDSIVKEGLITL